MVGKSRASVEVTSSGLIGRVLDQGWKPVLRMRIEYSAGVRLRVSSVTVVRPSFMKTWAFLG